MKVSNSQLNVLAAETMDRLRRERVLELRDKGFVVNEDHGEKALIVSDASGASTRVESRGLQCRIITAEGRTLEIEQHPSGRIRRIMDASGREVGFERDRDGYLQSIDRGQGGGIYRFKLSDDWKPLRIDYPDGTATLAEYLPTGEPSRIVNRDGSVLRYEYAPGGRLTALIDPQNHRTRVIEDGEKRSRVIEYPNGDTDGYFYETGARVLRFDVNGETQARYLRHPGDSTVETSYSDGSTERHVFANGHLVEATNEHATVRFQYDDCGRLLSEESNGKIVRYLRNEVGALVGIVTPEGDTLTYTRDRDQRLTGITAWNGDRYEILLPPSGPPSEIRYPNGLTVASTTNSMGLPLTWSVTRSAAGLESLDAAFWEHDTCDRLVSAIREGHRREYHYNKASRLVEVRSSNPTLAEHFDLDVNGNRVQSATGPCRYDSMNRLLRNGIGQLTYNGLGSLTEYREGRHASIYSYNGRGQLVGIKTSTLTVEFAYDALGRRTRKRIGTVTTYFHWAGTQLLAEITEDGTKSVRRDYLFCPEFLNPLAFREDSSIYYVHLGRLQEPLCVTDAAAAIVWKAEYLAYGCPVISVNKIRQPFRLPGQYHDVETGLHYAVARYYAPDLGRFLSMDPRRQPGASLNYYIYCDGDPINRVDPIGEISLTIGTVLVAVGIGIAVGAAVGAGVELYKERNQEHTDWGQVGRAALIGGALGGIGAAVGVVAGAATVGVLGVLGSGAASGGLGSAVTYCVQAAGQHQWNWTDFATTVAVGAGIGAVTAGIGGMAGETAEEALDDGTESLRSLKPSEEFFENTRYTDKVQEQMSKDDYHSFPEEVTNHADKGIVRTIKGGDGVDRQMLEIPGEYKGKPGKFEFIKEPDGSINHRYFRPDDP